MDLTKHCTSADCLHSVVWEKKVLYALSYFHSIPINMLLLSVNDLMSVVLPMVKWTITWP